MTGIMTKTPEGIWIRMNVDADALTPEAYADILDAKPLIEQWLKAVAATAEARVAAGDLTIPGWAMAPGRKSRDWKDEATAVMAMTSAGINDPYERKIRSPAQAEKLVGEDMQHLLEVAIEVKPGRPTLKRAREAAAQIAAAAPIFPPVADDGYDF